jgi:hypothetical protein
MIVIISTLSSMVENENLEFTYEIGKRVLAKVRVLGLTRAPHSCKKRCDECRTVTENSIWYINLVCVKHIGNMNG